MLNSFRKLWSLFGHRERINTGILLVLMVVGATFEVVGIGAIPAFIALLSDPERVMAIPAVQSVAGALGVSSANEFFLWAAGGLLIFFLLKNAFLAGLIYLKARFVYNRQLSLSVRLFERYLRAPYSFHLRRNTAELLRNTNQETNLLVQNVMMPGLVLVMELMVVAAVLILLVVMEPVVSIGAAAVLGLASVAFYRTVRARTGELGAEQQHHRREMIRTVNEGLGGIKDARVLGREGFFLDAFRRSADRFVRTARFKKMVSEVPAPFVETIAVLGLLLVAVILLAQGRPLQTVIPTLALFGAAAIRLMPSFNRITSSLAGVKFYHNTADVLHAELKAAVPGQRDGTRTRSPFRFTESIRLENVSYTYPGADRPSLQDVSLRIPRGSAVGFVGPSGAGKSTLVDLVLGLLTPTAGRISVDGRDIQEDVRGWTSRIGYIPQSIYLCDNTVRRNIAFGLPDGQIDEEAVREAVDAAQLREVVERLPQGLETVIGERGVRLSGGQRQRVGIARALYHRPEVLVMDEATSSVDNETERRIVETVERLHGERTILVIAHRLTTVRSCDRVYRLAEGRMVAEGEYVDVLVGEATNASLNMRERLSSVPLQSDEEQ